MKRPLVLALVSAVLAAATIAIAQPPQQPPQQQGGGTTQRTPEDEARRARSVAKVGDVTITVGDVEDAINQQSPFLRARYREPDRLREFVQNMIRFELLAKEAEKRGYGDDDAVVRSVKQNAVQQLIRREFDERITPESIPTEDVRAYYDSHQEEFNRPEMVRASHVLVATRADAERLLQQAREADARTFRQLAREHSIDTETKLRGGDLRYFTREGRPPNSQDEEVAAEIVTASFQLREVGDVVRQPVQVGEHFSIIKLTGRRPAEHRTFEEADQGIRLRLWRQRRQQGIEDFVSGLRRRYNPEVHEERMAPIRLDAAPEGGGHPGFPGHEGMEAPTKAGSPAEGEPEDPAEAP